MGNWQCYTLKPYSSILLAVIREITGLHIFHILNNGAGDLFVHIKISAQETGFEFDIDAQHIVHDQHLAIAIAASTDADGGDFQAFA